ncbi:MAG TPA: serine hydrolase domain-containing protein [Acidobacteriota bacterium]|nr:serine hydrolase domain-containing protein [Acidobacteriota bacterium]
MAAVLVLAGGCAPETRDAGNEVGTDNAAVDSLFADFDQPGSPGCGLAVAQDGGLIYTRGYGYANLDYDVPNTPQTVFDVGSVTKQFNAAALSMLVEEGKLSLDDDIRRWLPELPAYEPTITIRHLLHHTGGLRNYLNLFPLAGRNDYFPISHAQILAMMSRQRAPIFAAGERYRYSNTGYMLLAQILERAGGKSLGEMAQARIFDPLGMAGSHMYEDLREIIPGRGIGYDRDEAGNLHIVHNYNFDVTGDGQLYTTMPDLLRWDEWMHGNEPPSIHTMMLTEGHLNDGEPVGYAQGVVLSEYRGLRTVGHSGGSWGFVTQLVRFVEPRLSIAISCNAGWARPGRLAQQVADHYLADQLGPAEDDADRGRRSEDAAPAPQAWTAEQQSALTGEFYSRELDATYRFAPADDGMALRIEQEAPVEVTLLGDGTIEFSFGDEALGGTREATLSLERDRGGRVAGFLLSASSEHGLVFERR